MELNLATLDHGGLANTYSMEEKDVEEMSRDLGHRVSGYSLLFLKYENKPGSTWLVLKILSEYL